ncbi:hypothetical protein RZS08_29135, partial [Arthrospira platensis SPKY1]|nr:hypothetical protein [Arthrospira platensis SPKY1]
MLFMFVGNLYVVLIQRFSGYLRLFSGFLAAIALLGVVVSGDRTILWILLGLAAVVPFITVQPWKLKFKRLIWVMLALLGFTGLLWLTADLYTVQPRLAQLWRGDPLPERAVSENIGWNMLNQSPVSGQGIGA